MRRAPFSWARKSAICSTYNARFLSTPVVEQTQIKDLPSSARVVVVGGGVIGCALCYQLSKKGFTDVVLLEQHKLTSGTTWHAAGLIGTSRSNSTQTKLSIVGAKMYGQLEEETGFATGYKKCGSLTLARTDDRMIALQRTASRSRSFGLPAEIISPEECGKKWPGLLKWDDLKGGLWLPEDGSASPTDIAMSLASGARQKGVKIIEGVRVEEIQTAVSNNRKKAVGVKTSRGTISAEKVVICAGQWSRQIAETIGVRVPLHSAEHYYIITKPIKGASLDLPVLRDPDAYIYMREWSGGLCVGGFEPKALPIWSDKVPQDFAFSLLPDNWDQFDILFRGALERIPVLADAEIRQFVNGPESFTTDTNYILGETPEVDGLFVSAGFNSSGIASAGGAGLALAEWIIEGKPTMDLWPVDIRRFADFAQNRRFLRERTAESLGLHYRLPWPRYEFETARKLRCSPLYDRLASKGAVFGQKFGWERVSFYMPNSTPEQRDMNNFYTYGTPKWMPMVRDEINNTRNNVSVFDQSSFSKFIIQGKDALQYVQKIFAANMDVPEGKLVYTGMLNENGGYESDVTVTRVAQNKFYVVSPTSQAVRDLNWLEKNIGDLFVTVADVTSAYCVLGVMGPKSRELLQSVSREDMSNSAFPFGWSKSIDVGYNRVDAKRVTYVGELGWELHIPSECVQGVYDTLFEAGSALGIKDGGYYAMEWMRIEKGYRAWGHELDDQTTPLEAGLSFAVDFKKDFIGKEALLKQKNQGLTQRLFVAILNEKVVPWGDEAILLNGQNVGRCTSSGYSVPLDKPVCLCMIKHPDVSKKGFIESGKWEMEVNGVTYPTTLQLSAAYDPKGLKINCQL